MSTFSTAKALAALEERRDQSAVDAIATATAIGRRKLNPDDPVHRRARAAEQEKYLLEQYAYIQKEPENELKRMRLRGMLDRLGELAAEQGDYARAAAISHDEKRRRHYRHIRDAITRDDSKNCQCSDDRVMDHRTKTEFTSPAIMAIDTIVNEDGKLLSLDQCRKCGFLNAR